jgi:hypothetical protein
VAWLASASSNTASLESFKAFDNTYTSASNSRWSNLNPVYKTTSPYNYTPGSYAAYSTYINTIGIVSGEWLQIQSNLPCSITSAAYSYSTINGPGSFYICGSNDGNNWYPITFIALTANPATIPNISSQITIPNTNSNPSTAAYSNGTCITYGNTNNGYTYFRMVITNLLAGNDGYPNIWEWAPTFIPPTQAIGPSRTLLYMDATNINQLDVSGSLALTNTNPSTILVSPNTANCAMDNRTSTANSFTWQNNNVTWTSSASSFTNGSYNSWQAFDKSITTAAWASGNNNYNSTGVYTGSTSSITPTGQSAIQGEWLQLQSSVPLVMKYYTIGCVDTPLTYPRTFWIIGSNDGNTWNPIHYATTTATSGVYTAGTTTGSFTVTSSSAVNSFTTVTTFPSYSSLSYTYFRMVVIATFPNSLSTYTYVGEWTPIFAPASSAVSLALDNTAPNQLNIGGSIGVAGYVGAGIANPQTILDVAATSSNAMGALFRGEAQNNTSKAILSVLGTGYSGSLPGASGGGSLYFYYWSRGTAYYVGLTATPYFTGQHGNYTIDRDLKTNLVNYVGLLVSSADEGYYSTNQNTKEVTTGKNAITITEALPKVILTVTDKDPAVWGVVSNVKNDDVNPDGTIPTDDKPEFGSRLDEYTIRINGVGEGALWVTNISGNIKNGDWICSSIVPGYGRKQDDDLFHNYTAAKATMSCNFDINNDDLYQCKEVEFNGTTYLAAFIGVSYHCS